MEQVDWEKESKWICLSINERYNSYIYYNQVKDGIEKTFGDICEEILFVGDTLEDNHVDNILETYVFVKCRDIKKIKPELEKSKYIKTILNSFENVVFIKDKEINALKADWKRKKKDSSIVFFYGDIVTVKKGIYSELNGIIIDKKNKDEMIVLFKFNVGYRIVELHNDNLIRKKNIFETIKVPYKYV